MADDINKLIRMLGELDDRMSACMRCGMCQAVCPVFGETMKEADVTRGKIVLLENLAKELLKDPKKVKEKLDLCLLCGSCSANCPSGVRVMDIFLRARIIITGYLGLSTVKKLIFRGMLTRPKFFNQLFAMASFFQKAALSDESSITGTVSCGFLKPVLGKRHFPPLAKKALQNTIKSMDTKAGRSGIKVAFYPGCMLDKVYPHVAEACLRVFDYHGIGVFMPEEQACCGIPSLASGDSTSFTSLVRKNLVAYGKKEYDYIITACATCTSTIKKNWPMLDDFFTEAEQKKIRDISCKTFDISQLLVDIVGVTPPVIPFQGGIPVSFHDPCHLKKSLGVSRQPRVLVSNNPKYELIEMKDSDQCCGCGGSFNLQHYGLSKKIGKRKRDAIVAAKSELVATGCPACMLQLQDQLSQNQDPIRVKHFIEIYAEGLK